MLVLFSMLIFQNCTIAGMGTNELASCSDSGRIELFILKNKQHEDNRQSLTNVLGQNLLSELVSLVQPDEENPYEEDVLGASDVVLTLSDAQDESNISWQIHYTPEGGGQANSLFDKTKKTQELEFSFVDPGIYKIVAQNHSEHDSCNNTYQKTVRVISDINSSLHYLCPQGSVPVQGQVEASPPASAICPSGDAPYQLLLEMNNDFKTTCKIKLSPQLTQEPTKCDTSNTEMSVSITEDTQGVCQSITFGVAALNIVHARKVYYKLSKQGFFASQDSSWCTTDDNDDDDNTPDPELEKCYVHNTIGCYVNADSLILRQCKNRFTLETATTSCADEFINQCPNDLCRNDEDEEDDEPPVLF